MFRRISELRDPPVETRRKSINGSTPVADEHDDDFEPDMELDGQLQTAEDMEIEEAEIYGKLNSLLQGAVLYGRELREEFQNDESRVATLKDIFTFYAYEDARRSPFAGLLDWQARVPVAEELNSAILGNVSTLAVCSRISLTVVVSLGKSSAAAIERLIQQTEVLVDDISLEGGAGALINVRNDFLT